MQMQGLSAKRTALWTDTNYTGVENMKKIRSVQYGCGNLGKHTIRYMHEKGILVVGAIDTNPAIVGLDIGEIANLGIKTGVQVQSDANAVLDECKPDIAIVTLFAHMDEMYSHIMACVERGINVITSCEDIMYPWDIPFRKANYINSAACKAGVTVVGSGTQELYCNMLKGIGTTVHKIDKIKGITCDNTEFYSAAAVVPFGVGLTVDEFKEKFSRHDDSADFKPSYIWGQARLIVASMGWSTKSISQTDSPGLAEKTINSVSLGRDIPKGDVAGMETTVRVETHQGPVVELTSICRAYESGDERADRQFWEFVGEPNVRFQLSQIETFGHTGAGIVNRIPSVLKAPSGLLTLDELPMSSYHAYPIDSNY
jgi:4-hydroxy-tetrahydrodipicolinate reductase